MGFCQAWWDSDVVTVVPVGEAMVVLRALEGAGEPAMHRRKVEWAVAEGQTQRGFV